MAVANFNELFIDYLNFDYIDLTLFYNFIGCVGIFALASIFDNIKNKKNILYFISLIILFLPSLHFGVLALEKIL